MCKERGEGEEEQEGRRDGQRMRKKTNLSDVANSPSLAPNLILQFLSVATH